MSDCQIEEMIYLELYPAEKNKGFFWLVQLLKMWIFSIG